MFSDSCGQLSSKDNQIQNIKLIADSSIQEYPVSGWTLIYHLIDQLTYLLNKSGFCRGLIYQAHFTRIR